jgi:hypothetical protein
MGATMPGRPGQRDSLQADLSPISEVLNLAWAQHEITADHIEEVRPPPLFLLLLWLRVTTYGGVI